MSGTTWGREAGDRGVRRRRRLAVAITVAVIAVLPTVSTPATAAPSEGCDSPFADVTVTNPFCDEIVWMYESGLSNGDGDGNYRPAQPVTRQVMAAFLARLADVELPECEGAPFDDVPASHTFCSEISWLASEGISRGDGAGRFRPAAVVTRQTMVAFLSRFARAEITSCWDTQSDPFVDVPFYNDFCGDIAWAVESGVTEGYPDETFRPTAVVTRQAMAAFVLRLETYRASDPLAPLRGYDVLAALNFYRELAGSDPITAWDPQLSQGSFEHSRYTVEENQPGHGEDAGSPWSTPCSRGDTFACSGNGEVYFQTMGPLEALNGWMRTPFHGEPLVSPWVDGMGIGTYTNLDAPGITTATTGRFRNGALTPEPGFVGSYPADGKMLPAVSFWPGGENPDPLAPCGYSQPAGAPIWAYSAQGPLAPDDFTATLELDGESVSHCSFKDEHLGVYFIMAENPLIPGETYTASVMSSDGTITWDFETASDPLG